MDTNNTAELPNVNDKVQQSDASKENTDSVTKEQQRAYLTQIVTTNQSYQDITSQTFVAGNPLMGRLWSQQTEEDSDDEGDILLEDDQGKADEEGQLSGQESDGGVQFIAEENEVDATILLSDDLVKDDEAMQVKALELNPKRPDGKVQPSNANLSPKTTGAIQQKKGTEEIQPTLSLNAIPIQGKEAASKGMIP